MSEKENYIDRYGKESYLDRLQRNRVAVDKWQKKNTEAVRKNSEKSSREQHRSDGKYYQKTKEYQQIGISGEKNKLRHKHGNKWRPFKRIIAPGSVLHHEWIEGTARYRGLALVEKDQHQHGIVDVIQILAGKITLLTEKEIIVQGNKS